jgi:hypothetical protein
LENYAVKRFNGDWGAVSKARVSRYPWGCEYQPDCAARLAWSEGGLLLMMEALEPRENMRMTESGRSRFVHKDSCMEFFLQPVPGRDKGYINWEISPIGAYHVAVGTCRHDRRRFSEDEIDDLALKPFMDEAEGRAVRWGFTAELTADFIRRSFPDFSLKSGARMRGNFMKCGDETRTPHFGMWNPGVTPEPDYHREECFGDIVID